jgi:flavodoxin
MKIGIVVHSFSGNTMSVAERLAQSLSEKGYEADILRLQVTGGANRNQQDIGKIALQPIPDMKGFDNLIVAGPVRGFQASPVIRKFFDEVNDIEGKNVAMFVTHAFPYSFFGGKSAIGQMERMCREKGAKVGFTGIIDWGSGKREKQIETLVKNITDLM